MTYVVIGRRIYELIGFRVGMNRCETEIFHMIWPAFFIEEDVPVGPPHSAAVEVIDHGASIPLGIGPPFVMICIKPFLAALGEQELFGGKRRIDVFQIVIFRVSTRPRFIPMKSNPTPFFPIPVS